MKHSVRNRIIVGKTIGLTAGVLAVLILPVLGVELELMLSLGLVLFYVILGALTAFMGTMKHHPWLRFPMPWWFRGLFMGLIMHLMLVLLIHDQLAAMLVAMDLWGMASPWWALIDGAILGLIMAFAETKLAGEGDLPLE